METNGRPDHSFFSLPDPGDICERCGGLMLIEYYGTTRREGGP
jgi:hypothetical protein